MAGKLLSGVVQVIAVYVRISKDKAGRAENVATQTKLAKRYAASHWPGMPVEVYCDNDLSAADPNVFRPEYDRMLTDIRLGKVAHVVAADQDRLTRQPSEWEDLVVVLGSAGIIETHGYRDGITPVKGSKLVGRVKAAVSAEYVEGIKVKINEKLDELAAQGRPMGSLPFGYKHGTDGEGRKTLDVVEKQAAAIRWAAESVLAGANPNVLSDVAVAADAARAALTSAGYNVRINVAALKDEAIGAALNRELETHLLAVAVADRVSAAVVKRIGE